MSNQLEKVKELIELRAQARLGGGEKAIEKLTIVAPLSALDEQLIQDLSSLVKSHPGKSDLYFKVKDIEGQMAVDLLSQSLKVSVQKDLISYLKMQPELEYKVN